MCQSYLELYLSALSLVLSECEGLAIIGAPLTGPQSEHQRAVTDVGGLVC